jgi:hypothetical protein
MVPYNSALQELAVLTRTAEGIASIPADAKAKLLLTLRSIERLLGGDAAAAHASAEVAADLLAAAYFHFNLVTQEHPAVAPVATASIAAPVTAYSGVGLAEAVMRSVPAAHTARVAIDWLRSRRPMLEAARIEASAKARALQDIDAFMARAGAVLSAAFKSSGPSADVQSAVQLCDDIHALLASTATVVVPPPAFVVPPPVVVVPPPAFVVPPPAFVVVAAQHV